jgi:hypothetical protein
MEAAALAKGLASGESKTTRRSRGRVRRTSTMLVRTKTSNSGILLMLHLPQLNSRSYRKKRVCGMPNTNPIGTKHLILKLVNG